MAATNPPLFRILKILHTALTIGMLAFAGISFLIVKKGILNAVLDPSLDRILQVIAISLSALLILFGFRLFNKRVMTIRNSELSAVEKMNQYRAACITWWAMIEAPGLFAFICFLLVPNYAFLVLGTVHILILLVFMPKWANVQLLLKVNESDF
jgi:hypothetical protein